MNRLHWIVVGALGLGLGALLFTGWRFAIHPMDEAYAAKVDEKAQLESKLSDAKLRAAQYEKFQAEAENVRRDLEFYSRRLDEPLDTEELYGTLMAIMDSLQMRRTQGAEIETKVDAKTGHEVHTVTMEFYSDLDRLGRLLNNCITQQHIFLPSTLELTRYEDPDGQFRDTIKVKLVMDVLSGARGGK
jgi:hypothetical protein